MGIVLITGASSGIGLELAKLLEDHELILQGRTFPEDLKGQKIVQDLTVSLAPILQAIEEHVPDLVINSAAFGLYGDVVDHDPNELQKMIELNCQAVVAICQHTCRVWKEKGIKGKIINISSVLGLMPAPGSAVYGATKAFVTSFSEALDVEVEGYGIRVLTACPGRVATQFAERASKGKFKRGGLDPRAVAEEILRQKDPVRIIDWKYRLLLFVQKLVPKRTAMKRLYKSLKNRVKLEVL